MALKEQIQGDMKAALLSGNRFEGDVLRNLKAVILNEEVSKGLRETGLSDDQIEALIAKEVKKRQESVDLYQKNDREDLAKAEQNEIDVLKKYLPEQLSEEEIIKIVDEVISEICADNMKMMGQVVGQVKSKTGTKADGSIIAKIVKEKLSK